MECKYGHGGVLAEPKSWKQISYLRRTAKAFRAGHTWIGGIAREGRWTWGASRKSIDNFDWARGEPNSQGGKEKCIQLSVWVDHDYRWNDERCWQKYGFFCQL